MIDPEKLHAFAIPAGRQQVREFDHALYALSIGLGQDPLDERQLRFVNAGAGVQPIPLAVLVLAHPGFWLGDPRSGVNASRVVHADQSFEILDAIPVAGLVESRTRLTGVVDKGAGKAAILFAETVLEAAGRPFARLNRATLVRGEGGFGGNPVAPPPLELPFDGAPALTVEQATRPEQALLYRLNGDLNPLHSDPAQARAAGFPRPILHGLCTMGIIGHALLQSRDYDPARLARMTTRFLAPVFPGETLRTEIWDDGCFRTTATERDVLVATGRAPH